MLENYMLKLGYTKKQVDFLRNVRPLNELKEETLLENVKINWSFLITLGLTDKEIIKMSMRLPAIYIYDENNLKEKISFLKNEYMK